MCCVVSKHLQNWFRDGSSRLRGFGTTRREVCRPSIPRGIVGLRCHRGRMPSGWDTSEDTAVFLSIIVRMALVCVVSKYLRALLRGISSRLRGSAVASREWRRISVPRGIIGPISLPAQWLCGLSSLPGTWDWVQRVVVVMLFRCVVSERLRVLFRAVFFPSTGYRMQEKGALSSIGSNGYAWTSSPSGTNARPVEFLGSCAVTGTSARSYCFSLRCVQGFTEANFFVIENMVIFNRNKTEFGTENLEKLAPSSLVY